MLSEIQQFVNWIHRRNSEARTWKDYSYDLQQFASLVGDIPPEKATYTDVDRFINRQLERGFKPATINRRLIAIQSFYSYLCDELPTLVCPVIPHRHYLREPQHLPRPVQEEKLRLFFEVIQDARDKAMFTLMLRCGLRIGEVAGLKLSNLYLDEVRPRLITRGKGTRDRAVYLSPQAYRILRIYLAERADVPSDFVFLSYLGDGMSTTAIHKRLMHYRSQAEIHLTAHQLRHSFANDLLSANVPVTTIQKLLGHRWLETTQIYVEANDFQVQADYYAACLKIESWLL